MPMTTGEQHRRFDRKVTVSTEFGIIRVFFFQSIIRSLNVIPIITYYLPNLTLPHGPFTATAGSSAKRLSPQRACRPVSLTSCCTFRYQCVTLSPKSVYLFPLLVASSRTTNGSLIRESCRIMRHRISYLAAISVIWNNVALWAA